MWGIVTCSTPHQACPTSIGSRPPLPPMSEVKAKGSGHTLYSSNTSHFTLEAWWRLIGRCSAQQSCTPNSQ